MTERERAGGRAPIPPTRYSFDAPEDPERRARLESMKRRATALLVFFAALFVVTRLLEARFPWIAYVRATAEAAMVGGLADWFAVTALFRHPMGIPIPHTAIIPARKDRIGRALGGFVQNNFLSREVIAKRVAALHPAEKLAQWIADEENARRVARHVAAALVGASHVLRDEDVQQTIDRALISRVRKVRVAPLLGNLLAVITADGRHQALLDDVLRLAARAVADNEAVIRERIREESPWWIPELVDEKIHEKVVGAIERTLAEVSADPDHPLRARYNAALERFIDDLKSSPEAIAKAEALKEEVLDHPSVRGFSASLWDDARAALLRYAEDREREAPTAVERGLTALGRTVLGDPALLEKVDHWILDAVLAAVEQYRGEVGQLIESTVRQWDPDATSRKIELQVGRDLQFIRINGTLVGGLVGLILYVIAQLF